MKPKITLNVTSLPIQVKKNLPQVSVSRQLRSKAIRSNLQRAAILRWQRYLSRTENLPVKGLKVGKATVTVTSTKGAKATVKITVQKKKVATKKLSATVSKKQTLKKGKKVTLKVAKTPFTAQDTVKWTSSNKKVATVTSKGVVKG